MSKDYCGGCQERHYNDDMDNLYLCDACTTVLYQGEAEIEKLKDEVANLLEESQKQIDSLQQKVHLCAGYDKLQARVEQLEAALKPLAELCLTGVRGEIVFQRDETFIRKCDVILASQLIAGDSKQCLCEPNELAITAGCPIHDPYASSRQSVPDTDT